MTAERPTRWYALVYLCSALLLAACGSSEVTSPDSDPVDNVVTSVEVSEATVTLDARQRTTVTTTLRNASGGGVSGTVTWSSSDASVATVSSGGTITALLPGSATLTASSGSASATVSVTVEVADMTAFVQQLVSSEGLPAMGGALVTIDGLVAIGVAGERRIGGPAVALDDRWHIGSNLKAVTGFLCAIAVDDGVIGWDTTVPTLFPELTVKPEYQDVTLRDVCTNQSGLPRNPSGVVLPTLDPQEQRNGVAEWAFETSVPAATRQTYHYSNLGYAMAGAMLERAWGSTYEDALVDELFGPIGVTDFGWGPQTQVGASDNPVPHSWSGSSWVACEACDNPPWLSAAGRMHIRLADWAKIIQEMLRADQGTSSVIGAAQGQTAMGGAVDLGNGESYGYGWIVTSRSWANGRTLTHQGSNTLNSSVAWVAPERDFAVIAVTNAGGGDAFGVLDQLVGRLLTYYEDGS
ncbi:MAG: serine hydrolase [Gemmatimonadota bacterium]